MLLARLLPKYKSVSYYQSIITSRARNNITTTPTGNHVAARLVASSRIISHRPATPFWQFRPWNFDSEGSFRLYSRLPLVDCKTVDELLQLAVEQREILNPNQNAAMWTYIFRLMSKGQQQKVVHKEDAAQLELLIWDVLEVTMDSLPRMRPRDLTTIILQLAKIANRVNSKSYKRLSATELAMQNILFDEESNPQYSIFDPLAEAANQIIIDFEPRYLSNLAYAYSLLGYDPKIDDNTLLEIIADVSLDCIQQFNGQDISNMMWAYAKLNVSHEPLFQAVGDAIEMADDLTTFKPQAIANVVWSYATLDIRHPGLFKKVGVEIATMEDLESFDPQNLSNTVWAYATANVQHPALFKKVGDEIATMDDLNSFNPQNLANTVWAYATANEQHMELFKKIGDEIVAMNDLKAFNPQNLANTVWSYATANVQHPGLFMKVGHEIVAQANLASFNHQHISNILWAYATAHEQHIELFKKIADEIVAMDRLKSFDPQAFANTVWAYATANEQHPNLFKKIGNEIAGMKDLKSFDPQALSNTIWAYATANVQHPALFKKIGDEIVAMDDRESFDPQAIANVVWAYATTNIQHPDLFKKIGDEIAATDDWKSFSSQNLANIAWAYTVSNFDAASLFNPAFRQELLDRQNEFVDENLSQLYQWHLWQTKEKSNNSFAKSLQNRCKQIFSSGDTKSSALQKDVVSELTPLGLHPVEEYLTNSGYSIDALVEINGKKVGIEVDGPSHFIGRQPKGHTLLKRRQDESIDRISLVSVPYWEWDKLGKDRDKKQKYLKALLKLTT